MASSRLERIGTIFTRVEGLLTKGAIKPDDRPLWFDVYRAFPPITEPKFAQPKPEVGPMRQILYKEDVIRAKFHSQGHGFGIVNMLSPSGETHIKKLVNQYIKLQSEGVPEEELVKKAVEAVGIEKQEFTAKAQAQEPTTKNAKKDSVTSQVLKDANIKNIFNKDS